MKFITRYGVNIKEVILENSTGYINNKNLPILKTIVTI